MTTETKAKPGNPNFSIKQRESGSPEDRVFELKAVYKTKHTIQPAFDPTIGWYKGVDRLSDIDKRDLKYFVTVDDKDGKNTSITLEDGYIVDLNKEVDRINWEWMQHHPAVAMSYEEAQANPRAYFYVHKQGAEAAKKNEGATKLFTAMKHIMEDTPSNWYDRAMLLGHDLSDSHPELVKEFLLDTAKENPSKVINVYEGDTLALRLMILKAKERGLIKFEDNVHLFGSTPLGVTDEHIINYLMSPKGLEIARLIDRAVNPESFKED